MKDFIILLPNSKSKNNLNKFEKYEKVMKNKQDNFFIELDDKRKLIYENLLNLVNSNSFENLKKIFDLKDSNKLEKEIEIVKNFFSNETNYSIEKFSGVMFKAINYNLLNEVQKNNFNDKVIFVDSLFGLLKPLDKIPDYKLEFTTKFNFNLKKFWEENLSYFFENILQKDFLIIDLLPQTHKVFNKKIIESSNYFEINFFEEKNGEFKNVGHSSKKLKGELINYLQGFDKIDLNILKKFKHSENFKFNGSLSNENKIIFSKRNI